VPCRGARGRRAASHEVVVSVLEAVPVAVEREADGGVPGPRRDLLGLSPFVDPRGAGCVAQVVGAERRQDGRMPGPASPRSCSHGPSLGGRDDQLGTRPDAGVNGCSTVGSGPLAGALRLEGHAGLLVLRRRRPPEGATPGLDARRWQAGAMKPAGEEVGRPLGGGNMNVVHREGDTVVRHAGRWTPTVHRYLDYLHLAGIDWVPRPIAIMPDARGEPGQERLSYVAGDVPTYPLPDWVWSDEILIEGAQRLRRLHDASVGFASDGATWQSPVKLPSEVVCHNDFAPHNLVFHHGLLVGAIDFDFCSPGPRLWDIAYFATRAVPLGANPRRTLRAWTRLAVGCN